MSKIDVHHHFYPSFFTEALNRHGGDPSGWYIPDWTVEADRKLNKNVGVNTAILSMTAPGATIESDPKAAAALARKSNEVAAEIRDSDPEHYGFFASLPSLLETSDTLKEIEYAFDTLHADGVILFTRYGDRNDYLGHEVFRPIWAELNRRKAVVFIHPTHGVDTNLINPAMPQPLFDYPHETGRTAMDLIISGTLKDVAWNCKIILSHAGGTLPYLVYRAAGLLPHANLGNKDRKTTDEIVKEAKHFYFDTAISANPVTLKALYEFAPKDHVLFGTDFPNAPVPSIQYFTEQLGKFEMSQDQRTSVEYGAALELFPRLKVFANK